MIKAQYSAAEAQVRIGEAATGISREMSDVGLAVQRAKDKTESMQARADAIDELTAAGALEDFTSSGDDIDRQLKQIQQSGQVDDELAKLKAELGRREPRRRSSRARGGLDLPRPAAAATRQPSPRRASVHRGRRRSALDRRVEQREPARQVRLDRELLLELRLQLELGRVVALLPVARRDERPERAALEAVDPVDGMLAALEAERRSEQLRAESLRRSAPERDRVHGGDLILEVGVVDDHPLEAVRVGLPLDLAAGRAARGLDQRLDVVVDAGEVARRRAA